MADIDKIKQINKNIIKGDQIESFKEQIFDLITGNYDFQNMMVVSDNSKSLEYIPDIQGEKIITINPNKILQISTEHKLSFYEMSKLNELLEESVLAMDSMTHGTSRIIVLDKKDVDDNQLIAICRTDAENRHIEVNQVTSIYGKKNFETFLNRTYEKNKNIYCNNKTKEFIKVQGLQLPNEIINSLFNINYIGTINKSQEEVINKSELEKYFTLNTNNYRIPYGISEIKVDGLDEFNSMNIDPGNIGWNAANIKSILGVNTWTKSNFIDNEQRQWIHNNYSKMDNISFDDIYYAGAGIHVKNIDKIANECLENLSCKIASTSLLINGFSVNEDLSEVEKLVKDGIENNYPDFNKAFASKLNTVQHAELKPYIENWIDNLPEDGQIWASNLGSNAEEYFKNMGEGRAAANLKSLIENDSWVCDMVLNGERIDLANPITKESFRAAFIGFENRQENIKDKNIIKQRNYDKGEEI